MIFAAFLACVAHLFTYKTSGQSAARNIANGSALSDLVRFVSRLSQTLRHSLVSLSLTNGNGLSINPLLFNNPKRLIMRLTRKFFASKFPYAKQCASCRFFHSDVTIEELEDYYEDFVKDNICLFTNGYSFSCQYRSFQPPIDHSLRMPLKNKN